jgi:hypothetical protein
MNAATLPYWEQVRTVLPSRPPILILRAFAPGAFHDAIGAGQAREIGPGVALLRGPEPAAALAARPAPLAFTGLRAAVAWAALLLALLFAAGVGWSWAFLGPSVHPGVLVGSAPAIGAGMLILVGVPVSRAGVALGGWAGATVVAAVALSGAMAAIVGPRSTRRRRLGS